MGGAAKKKKKNLVWWRIPWQHCNYCAWDFTWYERNFYQCFQAPSWLPVTPLQTRCFRGVLAEDMRLFNETPPMIPYDNCFYLQGFLLPLSILYQLSCSVQLVCTAVSKYWRWSACARHLWKKLHNICFHFLNTSALSSVWCQHGLQN